MVSNKQIRQLILALNLKSSQVGITYVLKYEYVFNKEYKKMFYSTYITKFSPKREVLDHVLIKGGSVYVMQYISNEMKSYAQ